MNQSNSTWVSIRRGLGAWVVTALGALSLASGAMAESPPASLINADKERVAATLAANADALNKVLSDELNYAHSSGVVDDKKAFVDALVSGKSKYVAYDYEEQRFSFPAPGVALMQGRVKLNVINTKGDSKFTLSYLGVWRLEGEQWKFLAWQSCRLPDPEPAKAP